MHRSVKVRAVGSIIAIAFAALVFSITLAKGSYSRVPPVSHLNDYNYNRWLGLWHHHGNNFWEDLISSPRSSVDFVAALTMVIFWSGLSAFLVFLAIRNWFPSGEALHCDRSMLSVSKIGWFNLRGEWVTRTFPLKAISQMQFTVVQRGRGAKVYGIEFFADGKKQKIFNFISAPDADLILKGLGNLGADVRHDPVMPSGQ